MITTGESEILLLEQRTQLAVQYLYYKSDFEHRGAATTSVQLISLSGESRYILFLHCRYYLANTSKLVGVRLRSGSSQRKRVKNTKNTA